MKHLPCLPALISLLAMPVEAVAGQYGGSVTHMGTFAGARFQVPLGGKAASKPRAALAIAPTVSRISGNTVVRTKIGEGVALNFGRRPTLTLAGVPADQALGLRPSKGIDHKSKANLSAVGWIGIGFGLVAAVGVGALMLSNYCQDKEADICGDSE